MVVLIYVKGAYLKITAPYSRRLPPGYKAQPAKPERTKIRRSATYLGKNPPPKRLTGMFHGCVCNYRICSYQSFGKVVAQGKALKNKWTGFDEAVVFERSVCPNMNRSSWIKTLTALSAAIVLTLGMSACQRTADESNLDSAYVPQPQAEEQDPGFQVVEGLTCKSTDSNTTELRTCLKNTFST